jgi:hypothetical protein
MWLPIALQAVVTFVYRVCWSQTWKIGWNPWSSRGYWKWRRANGGWQADIVEMAKLGWNLCLARPLIDAGIRVITISDLAKLEVWERKSCAATLWAIAHSACVSDSQCLYLRYILALYPAWTPVFLARFTKSINYWSKSFRDDTKVRTWRTISGHIDELKATICSTTMYNLGGLSIESLPFLRMMQCQRRMTCINRAIATGGFHLVPGFQNYIVVLTLVSYLECILYIEPVALSPR